MPENTQMPHTDTEAADPNLSGIGGWLILPAIGFVAGPILGVLLLMASLGMYPDVARNGYGNLYLLEIVVSIGLLGFWIYASVLFFRKKRSAPGTFIAFLVVSLAASCILLAIELGAEAEVFAIETGKQLIRDSVGAAIWIPYFRVSKRVKATFVH